MTDKNNIHAQSDIDLIIIKKTSKRLLDRLEELYRILKPRCGIDILAYTPEEFSEMAKTNRFIKNAVKNGIVLYEKPKEKRIN